MLRIGYLGDAGEGLDALRDALHELGYIDGQNVLLLPRTPTTNDVDVPARALVAMPVDLIVASRGGDAVAARRATSTIPIVINIGDDPVEAGLVESLARPGGNVTGIAAPSADVAMKRLDLLHEAFPFVRRPLLVWAADAGTSAAFPHAADKVVQAGKGLGIEVLSTAIPKFGDMAPALAAAPRDVDALMVLNRFDDVTSNVARQFVVERRLPSIWATRQDAADGALMAYMTDRSAAFRRVAMYVDKILKGARPADLPVERPTQYEFVVNLRTARTLGLSIPSGILIQATRVLQ